MKKLRLAYFGSPDFSARFLEKMLGDHELPIEVVQVITPKDKPVGRKGTITAVPVKELALKHKIPVDHDLSALKIVDIALLFAYGELLPKEILAKPKHGFWNIHPSLLPEYRGAAPIASALIDGLDQTGVTLMKMDEQLDHGPVIAQKEVDVSPSDRHPELALKLSDTGYELFKKAINELVQNGSVSEVEQDHSKATITKTFAKQDGYVDPKDFVGNSTGVFNKFRGLYPWPGIWTKVVINGKEQRLKITDMELTDGKSIVKKVQLEGKNEVDYETFKNAYKIEL